MENGAGVAHLVTGHPFCLLFSYLSCPIPPSLHPPTLPRDQQSAGVSFVRSFFRHDRFGAGRDKAIAIVWRSFKLRPFAIAIANFTVAQSASLLK